MSANQTTVAQLTPLPAPAGTAVAADFNQLMVLIAKYMEATVLTTGQFFSQGPTDPATDKGLFFNTTQKVWKYFSIADGQYDVVSLGINIGDIFSTTVAGDIPAAGIFVLDGRAINTLPATAEQQAALTVLYPSGNLPSGSSFYYPQPKLKDLRTTPDTTDQIDIGWVLANGRFTAAFPGASALQQANLISLYGEQIPYIPISTQLAPFIGDQIDSYVAGDDINDGWVQLDGRTITAIPGISAYQIANATAVYGGAVLPTIAPGGSPVRYARSFIGYVFAPASICYQVFIGYPVASPALYYKVYCGFSSP